MPLETMRVFFVAIMQNVASLNDGAIPSTLTVSVANQMYTQASDDALPTRCTSLCTSNRWVYDLSTLLALPQRSGKLPLRLAILPLRLDKLPSISP